MMVPPFASPANFLDALSFQGEKEGYWYLFQEAKDFLLIDPKQKCVPSTSSFPLKRDLYLGTLKGTPLFAGELDPAISLPLPWEWSSLRSLFGILSDEHIAIAGRAMQLLHWDRAHQYCGCCATPTVQKENERCRECPSCGHLNFAKLAPVIMALVTKGDQILLARGPHFPKNMYSVLAGFVHPGETLEQCLKREVLEETGIQVKNIRYFGSQPWPFSHSLIMGFTCEWASGDIHIDLNEIVAADWFHGFELPELPHALSLARLMIDAHLSKSAQK